MPRDAFSDVMGDLHGASRPVDEGAHDPRFILLDHPSEPWRLTLLRDTNELLVNIGELGLSDNSDETRELIINVCALLLGSVRENPETSDEELGDLAAYGLATFRAMPPEQRPR